MAQSHCSCPGAGRGLHKNSAACVPGQSSRGHTVIHRTARPLCCALCAPGRHAPGGATAVCTVPVPCALCPVLSARGQRDSLTLSRELLTWTFQSLTSASLQTPRRQPPPEVQQTLVPQTPGQVCGPREAALSSFGKQPVHLLGRLRAVSPPVPRTLLGLSPSLSFP